MDVASLDHVLFANGGELGARMAAIDWAATPLGPVSSWPPSLKTCVRILLTSRQPMFVWWGPSLVNLYNDAYKAIAGGKHPHSLGQPAGLVWREIWAEIEPRVESAMRENVGTYDEALLLIMERHGYREETYYTFSYSPVPGDDGLPGGIICANTDDTDRIIGERQLALLRELGARTTEARTVEEVCRLAAEGLATNGRDLPFAAIYLDHGEGLVLHGAAGIAAGSAAAPTRIGPDASAWLGEGYGATEPRLHLDVAERTGRLPTGAWDEPPKHVATLTLNGLHGKAGLLVVGLNPFRPFDERYQRFLLLVAGQIEASLASAGAYEAERRRAEELAELDRAKTAFFSNVSHEFRTPLTLMLGPLEDSLVDAVAPLPAPQRDRVEVVKRNSLRLLRLVNTLLDFSRIEAGRTRVVLALTDLASLTTDLASTFRSAMERAGLALVVDTPKLSRPVVVDRDMWEKIVLNLLSNAFKFTFAGKVEVRLRERGDRAELVVSDTGTGIPAAELPKIFDRFHRIDGARARTHEGSGIGLALVHELVKTLGGSVSVTSTEGRGTAFTVTLPFGDAAHIAAPSPHDTSPRESTAIHADAFVEEALRWLPNDTRPPASERPSGRPTMTEAPEAQPGALREPASARTFEETVDIVVADDNADMRDYVARLLRARWTVRAVADGREALAAVRARRPTLIVTDVMMPNLDGFGLIRELRADPRTQAIPVLMLSARAGEESRVEGLEAGADDYLVKPFSARELLARVATRVELERLGNRLERERAAIASLFERAPIPVAILRGPDLVLEVANPACAAVLGREVRGKRLVDALPELEAQGYVAQFREVQHTREPVIGVEARIELVRDERRIATYWNYIFAPLASDHGDADSVVAICTDVTAQVRARERAASLAEEASAANRAKDEFLAMLGHELRNPLAPITTALELLRLRGVSSREQSVIERQVAHLTRLVDDLLDVSRITRAKVELRRQPSELGPIVASALEIASPLLEQKGHHVELDVAREGLVLDVDRDRIAQVLANLLTNAAKYSDDSARIDVRARREGPHVRIEVEDRGIGIAPEMLPRIFEAFVQQPQAIDRSKGGLGLGLAIVRGLVEAHGGVVRAESAGNGRGSVFIVELPAAEGKAASAPARETASDVPTRELRVLVVDDNDDAAEVLSEALMSLGYQTAVANDGPNALAIAEVFRPRIALLDIGLPVMDGYELARRLRELPTADPLLELIAVTGYGQDRDRERAREAGFGRHLVKPLDLELLRQVLRGVQSPGSVAPRNELGLDAGRGD